MSAPKSNRFLRLSRKCIPAYPPTGLTLIYIMALDIYNPSTFTAALWTALLGLSWGVYLISVATEKQMDIFENYREQKED